VGNSFGKLTPDEPRTNLGRDELANEWPTNSAWDFVALGKGHDTAFWTEFLRVLHDVDPNMLVNIEHKDTELDRIEGLGIATQTAEDAPRHSQPMVIVDILEASAVARFDELAEKWGTRYPAVIKLWRVGVDRVRAVPGLRRGEPPDHLHDQRDRVAQCSVPAGDPCPRALPDRAGRPQMPLPGDQIARPNRPWRGRWVIRWKPALNAFAITFEGRIVPSTTN
jgi:hypothetical protein